MNATVTKTKEARPVGVYVPTDVDVRKAVADFLVVACGRKTTIQWQDGRVDHVTSAALDKLKASHVWATDF